MIIVLNHYNTNRESCYGTTWQNVIFGCLKTFSGIKIIVIDWGSNDGSSVYAKKICKQEDYIYEEISDKGGQFSWFSYMIDWMSIMIKHTDKEEYILYVEADTYICGDKKQLLQAEHILKDNKDVGLVNLLRLDWDGIRPIYVHKEIENGFILPKIKKPKKSLNFKKQNHELLSFRRSIRGLWNTWDVKCTLFRFSCFYSVFKDLHRSKIYRKDRKKGFYNFADIFCKKYECAVSDYFFSYNYGTAGRKYDKAIEICNNNHNDKIKDICKNSILYYK